jgi:hypothetical protein
MCFLRAILRFFFPVLGLIPRFQNPVKYMRGFNIYHETVHFPRRHPAQQLALRYKDQWVIGSLGLPEEAFVIIGAIKKRAAIV